MIKVSIFLRSIGIFLAVSLSFTAFGDAVSNPWVDRQYKVSGSWTIEEQGGSRYLVLADNFKTKRGPDVKVFLAKPKIENIGNRDNLGRDSMLLGVMTRFSGQQKYLIPEDVVLTDFQSVVLYCERYTVVWGGANLR
ncbi:MAG: DM13 domain-containing protein [Amphritea sp.]